MLQWLFGRPKRTREQEARRMAGCKQVVLDYADGLGFIARECISRDELEQLITDGKWFIINA